jgi:hypothetical protein
MKARGARVLAWAVRPCCSIGCVGLQRQAASEQVPSGAVAQSGAEGERRRAVKKVGYAGESGGGIKSLGG